MIQQVTDCALCEGIADYKTQEEKMQFKGKEYTVLAHFYKCRNCEKEFTTTAQDDLTINQLYQQAGFKPE